MVNPSSNSAVVAGDAAAQGGGGGGGGGVSLGKGAWDCDTNSAIPPEKEAIVFEEIATMDLPFEGIPTVPPRKDMDHFAFFCGGCRYLVSGQPEWTVAQVKQALFEGGIARTNKPEGVRNTPGIQRWQDLALVYAGQRMENEKTMADYHVPPVSVWPLFGGGGIVVVGDMLCLSARLTAMGHGMGGLATLGLSFQRLICA